MAGLTTAQRSKNVESFEVVWKTIRDKHFDPKLGGLDWQAVHDTLRPKVEAATTMKDARAVMSEAIERLHQTHFGIIPAELYEGLENPNEGPGEVGLDVRLIDGRAVVSAVAEGRPARRAGVKTGWVVDKIDGKPVSQLLKTAEAAYAHTGMVAAYQTWAVLSRLHGAVGSKIAVDFLDDKDKPVHSRPDRGRACRSSRDLRQPSDLLRAVRCETSRSAPSPTCRSTCFSTWSTYSRSLARRSRPAVTPTG